MGLFALISHNAHELSTPAEFIDSAARLLARCNGESETTTLFAGEGGLVSITGGVVSITGGAVLITVGSVTGGIVTIAVTSVTGGVVTIVGISIIGNLTSSALCSTPLQAVFSKIITIRAVPIIFLIIVRYLPVFYFSIFSIFPLTTLNSIPHIFIFRKGCKKVNIVVS